MLYRTILTLLLVAACSDDVRHVASEQQPTRILHYMYFPVQANAEQAHKRLHEHGYIAEVRPAAVGSDWLVLVKQDSVESRGGVEHTREILERMALELHGEYDGWEMEIQSR